MIQGLKVKSAFRIGVQAAVVAGIAAFGIGCGSSKKVMSSDSIVKKDGVLSMDVEWVKDKKKKYDIRMHIRNESKGFIIVKLNDMQCFRGDRSGTLKHTFFNTGERTIDFNTGESKTFNMVCDLGSPSEGDYRITIAQVYENPSRDGATLGKSISGEIEWKSSDEK